MSINPTTVGKRLRPAPAIMIRVQLEERPELIADCMTEDEEDRLLDWINANEDLALLVGLAVELRDAAEAA